MRVEEEEEEEEEKEGRGMEGSNRNSFGLKLNKDEIDGGCLRFLLGTLSVSFIDEEDEGTDEKDISVSLISLDFKLCPFFVKSKEGEGLEREDEEELEVEFGGGLLSHDPEEEEDVEEEEEEGGIDGLARREVEVDFPLAIILISLSSFCLISYCLRV